MAQAPDTRPGFYYVTVMDGPRAALALGPFENDHRAALDRVDDVKRLVQERTPRGWFYAFGTSRAESDLGPGKLNGELVAAA